MKMAEKKKVNSGIDYKNKKWRPSVFIDKDKQESIEQWIAQQGYKSFNEYIIALIDRGMDVERRTQDILNLFKMDDSLRERMEKLGL